MTGRIGKALRLLGLSCALVVASWCFGQQPFPGEPPTKSSPPAQQQNQTQPPREFPADPNMGMPTFHVSTTVVVVPTLVEKRNGEVLFGLKPSDFAVFDNGIQQKIHVDDDLDTQPVSLVVCVERGRDAPMEFDKIGKLGPLLEEFIGDGHGEVALVAFDSRPVWVEPFTNNPDSIEKDLRQMPGGDGGAAILDAVGYSVNLLEQQPPDHRRVLLLISESRDHGSHRFTIPQLVERIGTSNTLVQSLVFSPSKAEIIDWARGNTDGGTELNLLAPLMMAVNGMRRNTPKALAALSGGEYDPFTRDKGFQNRVLEAGGHARNRYILSFRPTDLTPGLHTIQVKLTQDYGAHVIARNSYWAIHRDDTGAR